MGKKKVTKRDPTKKQSSEEYDEGKEYAVSSVDSDDRAPLDEYDSPGSTEIDTIIRPDGNKTEETNAGNNTSDEESAQREMKKNKKKKNKKKNKKNKKKSEDCQGETLDELLALSGDEGRERRLTEAMRRVKIQSEILRREREKFEELRIRHNLPLVSSDGEEEAEDDIPPPSYEHGAHDHLSPTSSQYSLSENESIRSNQKCQPNNRNRTQPSPAYSPLASPPYNPTGPTSSEEDSPSYSPPPEFDSIETESHRSNVNQPFLLNTPGNYRIILSARRRHDTGSPESRRTESYHPRLIRREERGGVVVNREVSGWRLEERENGLYVAHNGTTSRNISHLLAPQNGGPDLFLRAENSPTYNLPLLEHPEVSRSPSPTGTYATRIIQEARNLPLPPGFGRQEYEPYINKGEPPPSFYKPFHGSDIIIKTSDKVDLHCHAKVLNFMCQNAPKSENNIIDLPYESRGMIRALQLIYGVEERFYDPFNLDEYVELSEFYAKYLCRAVYNHVYSRIQTWPFDQQIKYYVATVRFLPIHNIYLTWLVSYKPRATFYSINEYYNKRKTPINQRFKFPEAILKALQIKVPKLPNDPIPGEDD